MADIGQAAPYRAIDPMEVVNRVADDVTSAQAELESIAEEMNRLSNRRDLLDTFVKAADSFTRVYMPRQVVGVGPVDTPDLPFPPGVR